MKAQQAQIFDLPFFTSEFRKAWEEWLQYRSERKLPKYVPTGLKKTFSKLISDSHNNEQRAIAIIERAMAGNWQGLHPDKAEVVQMVPKQNYQPPMKKKVQPTELRQMTDEEMDEWIEGYRNKADLNVFFIPVDFYPYLERKGNLALSKEEKRVLLEKAIPFRKKELSDDEPGLIKLREMESKGVFTGDEVNRLKDLAKKIAVNEFLKK